jgi:Flp pilus assembly protein TadB
MSCGSSCLRRSISSDVRNPLGSEAEAFRFLWIVVGGALAIVVAAAINTWVGVAVAVIAFVALCRWLLR